MVLNEPEAWFAANQNNFDALQFLQFIENYAGLAEEKGQSLTLPLLLSIFRELCEKSEKQEIWTLFQGYPYKRHCELVSLLFGHIEIATNQNSDKIEELQSQQRHLEEELEQKASRLESLERQFEELEAHNGRLADELEAGALDFEAFASLAKEKERLESAVGQREIELDQLQG